MHGFVVDTLEFVEMYNESCFGNAMINSDDRRTLSEVWRRVLAISENCQRETPLTAGVLASVATFFLVRIRRDE